MKKLLTIIILIITVSSCEVTTKYHEPTNEEKEYGLRMLNPVAFKGSIQKDKNMGLKVRNHRLEIVTIDSISQNIINDDSSYCYKWDSLSRKLELILTVASLDYDSHIFEGYKLVKEKNSDKIKVYDWNSKFVKEFKVFE
jgi:hypothetical protein